MPEMQKRLEELSKMNSPETRGHLVDWCRQVRAWHAHADNCPALYRTLAYESLKQWLMHIPVDRNTLQESLQWLNEKLGN